jgi:hypothetical protein
MTDPRTKTAPLLHPELALDPRATQGASQGARQQRLIFESLLYRIHVSLYDPVHPSALHLLCALVELRDEGAQILLKLGDFERTPSWPEVTTLLRNLEQLENRGPYPLIRDAKVALSIPFTLRDRAAFRMAGLDLPRPPKSFWSDPETLATNGKVQKTRKDHEEP